MLLTLRLDDHEKSSTAYVKKLMLRYLTPDLTDPPPTSLPFKSNRIGAPVQRLVRSLWSQTSVRSLVRPQPQI